MRKIGIIGGVSWPSSIKYYEEINRLSILKFGKERAANLIMESLDSILVAKYLKNKRHLSLLKLIEKSASNLKQADSEVVLLASNALHNYSEPIESLFGENFIKITKSLSDELDKRNVRSVGLLGTKYIMESSFYKASLIRPSSRILTPPPSEWEDMNDIIFDKLIYGEVDKDINNYFSDQITELEKRGADVVVLGCTELSLLNLPTYLSVPLLDSIKIHSMYTVKQAILYNGSI